MRKTRAAPEADGQQQDHAVEQRLPERRHVEHEQQVGDRAQVKAPKIEPIAEPKPPNSDVPPITTAAIELSV